MQNNNTSNHTIKWLEWMILLTGAKKKEEKKTTLWQMRQVGSPFINNIHAAVNNNVSFYKVFARQVLHCWKVRQRFQVKRTRMHGLAKYSASLTASEIRHPERKHPYFYTCTTGPDVLLQFIQSSHLSDWLNVGLRPQIFNSFNLRTSLIGWMSA